MVRGLCLWECIGVLFILLRHREISRDEQANETGTQQSRSPFLSIPTVLLLSTASAYHSPCINVICTALYFGNNFKEITLWLDLVMYHHHEATLEHRNVRICKPLWLLALSLPVSPTVSINPWCSLYVHLYLIAYRLIGVRSMVTKKKKCYSDN